MKWPTTTKRWPWVVFLLIFMAFIGLQIQQRFFPHQTTLTIAGEQFPMLLANTDALRFQGLSNRANLGTYGGMIFTFPTADYYTFVMRDMLFPLDMVWINGAAIVDIKPNLPPEAGRSEADLTRYVSGVPATMVIELPAGFTAAHGVKVGDTVAVSL